MNIADQNDWVHGYSYEERPADEVAEEWIGDNLDTVAEWLDGVAARDGSAAIERVRARYP